MARPQRKKITWKEGAKGPKSDSLRLPSMVPDVLYEGPKLDLRPGQLFFTKFNLEVFEYHRGVKAHPLKYVGETWLNPDKYDSWSYPAKILRKDSIAIYVGTTRVEEADPKGYTISRLRHTFMIDGSCYMTNNLNGFFQPNT